MKDDKMNSNNPTKTPKLFFEELPQHRNVEQINSISAPVLESPKSTTPSKTNKKAVSSLSRSTINRSALLAHLPPPPSSIIKKYPKIELPAFQPKKVDFSKIEILLKNNPEIPILKAQIADLKEKLAQNSFKDEEIEYLTERVSSMDQLINDLKTKLISSQSQLASLNTRYLDVLGKVRVMVRVRPPSNSNILIANNKITVKQQEQGPTSTRETLESFSFDNVFGPEITQEHIFEEIGFLINEFINLKNVVLFAYGQTNSGKTYTMLGDESHPGIIPRSIKKLFETVDLHKNKISVGFCEIYLNEIFDLFSNEKIKISSSGKIDDLTFSQINNFEEFNTLFYKTSSARKTRGTAMNRSSSRSHLIIKIRLINIENSIETASELILIDLAGSEKFSSVVDENTTNSEQIHKETIAINTSLNYLISMLSSIANSDKNVPSRESTITKYLYPYISDRSAKSALILNIHANFIKESLSTLNVGKKVAKIQRK